MGRVICGTPGADLRAFDRLCACSRNESRFDLCHRIALLGPGDVYGARVDDVGVDDRAGTGSRRSTRLA